MFRSRNAAGLVRAVADALREYPGLPREDVKWAARRSERPRDFRKLIRDRTGLQLG
jgi:hypothetical protein